MLLTWCNSLALSDKRGLSDRAPMLFLFEETRLFQWSMGKTFQEMLFPRLGRTSSGTQANCSALYIVGFGQDLYHVRYVSTCQHRETVLLLEFFDHLEFPCELRIHDLQEAFRTVGVRRSRSSYECGRRHAVSSKSCIVLVFRGPVCDL